ncbi:MAG TPA: hypothetical protein VKC56_10985 [Gallionellaceae bacterium]|nr:hypothetical protein [Gallionellaceae bacterium]
MKKFFYAAALALLSAPVFAQDVGVGVNVTIGQPGFYGQIILGNAPPPELIYPQPVIVAPGPMMPPPIYLRVPPGYERHWRRHCHEYNACGRPVYFVRDRWYNNVYVPHYRRYEGEYRRHHGEWGERRFDRDRDRDRGHRDEGRGRRRGEGRDRD